MSRMVVLSESELRRMLDEAVERGANMVKDTFRKGAIRLGDAMAHHYHNTLYENYVPRYEDSDSGGCGSSDSGGCGVRREPDVGYWGSCGRSSQSSC